MNRISINRKTKSLLWLTVTGVILAVVIFYGWFRWDYSSKNRIFWDSIKSSLSTSSVTKKVSYNQQGSQLIQTTQLSLARYIYTHSLINAVKGNIKIDVEEINTLGTDYVRYTSIKDTTKALPASYLKQTLNVWGKASFDTKKSASLNQSIYQSQLGVVPTANLSASEADKLVSELKSKVYSVDFDNITHEVINGQKVDTYKVSVAPLDYANFLNDFAKADNLPGGKAVNPDNYKNQSPISVSISVNHLSHRLVRVKYSSLNETDDYSGFGAQVRSDISKPTQTIPMSTLGARISNLSQQ